MKLVDAAKLFPDVMKVDGSMAISQGQLAHAKTVEAIPKADYEARLKADMVAMLTDIQLEIAELPIYVVNNEGSIIRMEITPSAEDVYEIIQKKINSLKENTDGNN